MSLPRIRSHAVLAGLLVGCTSPTSDVPVAEFKGTTVEAEDLDEMLARHVESGATVGLSALVVHGGELVAAKGFGFRSLEERSPVEAGTRFAIGSITKQFTCACAMLLVEDGKLVASDPVSKWYPGLTRADDVLVIDLMQHTSGYPDYYPLDYVDRRMATPIEPDDLLARYAGGELDFEPRTKWSYSNTGYILLGRIVEKVSGQPFGQFLRERILEPLEMHDTTYEPNPTDASYARGYEIFALGPPEPRRPEASGWIGAAGGIWSTPRDLVKWNRAVLTARLLSHDSWQMMRTEGVLTDGRRTGYGCGLSVARVHGHPVYRHGGAVDGFHAFNAVVPSTGTSITLLTNQNGGVGALGMRLLDELLQTESPAPEISGPTAEDVVRELFAAMQRGSVDRGLFTVDFDAFLTEARLVGAAERLAPLGEPGSVRVSSRRERGGMEVTSTRLEFDGHEPLRAIMYREPDGKVAQFFVSKW